MSHQYCTETEFQRHAPEAVPYVDPRRKITGWELHSGTVYKAHQTGSIAVLFMDGTDLGSAEANLAAVDAANEWFYDSAPDVVYVYNASANPDTLNMEAGEDHATAIAWLLQQASALIDEVLDAHIQVPVPRNRSGAYPASIIRATAFQAAYMATLDQNPALAETYAGRLENEHGRGLLDRINEGAIRLPGEVDPGAARGEVSEVAVTGGLALVETRGLATGIAWDLVKVIVTQGGALGTATYSIYGYDDATKQLKNRLLVEDETINGQYQELAYGLTLRFQGDDNDTADLNDEWEVELRGAEETVTHGIHTHQAVRG
ncbi:MAG: hypothetical protein IH971_04715 [Candidatus Marinimicrobia bacterium]|nr:hypothetical protein [Candidatus Neomarinimicrobiota bacterium]